jgi:hypothetical protein
MGIDKGDVFGYHSLKLVWLESEIIQLAGGQIGFFPDDRGGIRRRR